MAILEVRFVPIKSSLRKLFVAGVAAGVTLNLVMLLTFRLLGMGWNGGGILLDPAIQSGKLFAVWTQIQPLPLIIANPVPMILGLMVFGIGHAIIYQWLAIAWPPGIRARALRMAFLIFFLSFLFWEFFTPYNLFGEPALLIGLELIFWATIAICEGFAITAVLEWR